MDVNMPPPSFFHRVGTHPFSAPSPLWGYLPQVNEWAKGLLEWSTERVGGSDHVPLFKAVPIYRGEILEVFAAIGLSKKAAKEQAARLMALSGHC